MDAIIIDVSNPKGAVVAKDGVIGYGRKVGDAITNLMVKTGHFDPGISEAHALFLHRRFENQRAQRMTNVPKKCQARNGWCSNAACHANESCEAE